MASSPIPKTGISITTGIPWANVLDYGAIADDSHDCTAAFNAAIQAAGPDGSVYVPKGTYLILGQIEMNGLGVTLADPWGKAWPSRLFGDGRQHSILHIPASAASNVAITYGTIHAAAGVIISDLQFAFDQPENNPDYVTGTAFYHYQPAINVDLTFRTATPDPGRDLGSRFMRLRICRAWDGIQSVGGPGGGTAGMGKDIFEDIEISMLNKGFILDGYTALCRFDKIHVFPFGMVGNQFAAFKLQDRSVAMYLGGAPFILITNSVFLNGMGIQTFPSTTTAWAGNGPYLEFVNCKWDTYSVVKIGGGSPNQGGASFTQCSFGSSGVINGAIVNIYYGPAKFTGCTFAYLGGGTADGPLISNQSSFPVQVTGCEFRMANKDHYAILSQGGTIQITGCNFNRANGTYTLPVIDVTAGPAIVTGNICEGITTGSGVFLNLTDDTYHTVSGNNAMGLTMGWITNPAKVQAFGNTLADVGVPGQNLSLGVKQLALEGGTSNNIKVLSGSGSPAGVITADPGSLYLSTGGNVYVKSTGTGSSGWSVALS